MTKLSLPNLNSLLVARMDADQIGSRVRAMLTQVGLITSDLYDPRRAPDIKLRLVAVEADLRAILARASSIESRVRICVQDLDGQSAQEPPAMVPAPPPAPAAAPAAAPAQITSPWSDPQTTPTPPAAEPVLKLLADLAEAQPAA